MNYLKEIMGKEEFKLLCRKEFDVQKFSKAEDFLAMTDLFGIPGRTYQNWIVKDNVRPWFDKMVCIYLENKKLKEENEQLSDNLLKFNERLSKLTH